MKTVAPHWAFTALVLILALQAQTPAPSRAPWQPRPMIIVDPRPYLSSPSPHQRRHATPQPKHRSMPQATPVRRGPSTVPTPETFERLDTSPSPAPRHRLED